MAPYKVTLVFTLLATGSMAFADTSSQSSEELLDLSTDKITTETLHVQVLLDRALFSPGALDGLKGKNLERAIQDFQKANKLDASGTIDDATSKALVKAGNNRELATTYTITQGDVEINYIESLPDDMKEQANLEATAYTDIQEMLAERFHTTPAVLKTLNPDIRWEAGETIVVPNVEPTLIRPAKKQLEAKDDKDEESKYVAAKEEDIENSDPKDVVTVSGLMKKQLPGGEVTVTVVKETSTLRVRDKDGNIVFRAPVTSGSEKDPLPIGEWKINGTERYPKFNYNPELFWDAEDSEEKAEIPHGPNNPVGVAWIDITKEHYGLHGTPEPTKIGYTESHGCVRLTNWDVLRLADMVEPETKVYFVKTEEDDKLATNSKPDTANSDDSASSDGENADGNKLEN